MLNYETALALKEAGFPFKEDVWFGDNQIVLPEDAPTLTELIEACGNEGFMLVFRPYGAWVAKVSRQDKNTNIVWSEGEGDSPETAVAALYLSLHGKKD